MLLIVQNGLLPAFITKYLDVEYRLYRSQETDVSELPLDSYKMVIILGGHQSATHLEFYPGLKRVTTLIQRCLEIQKPLLGICLGSQLIAHVLGCSVRSSGRLNIGYDVDILGHTNVFRCHIDHIVPNDSIEVLEEQDGMVYLYRHSHHVIGIQCHPDITPEGVKSYSNCSQSSTYAGSYYHHINLRNRELIQRLVGMCLGDP